MEHIWKRRLENEKCKLARLGPGGVFTLAFLGIGSEPDCADATRTARSLPEFSGRFGLVPMDFGVEGNGALLPNDTSKFGAFFGTANERQVQMAQELGAIAISRDVRLQVVTHSNGVNGAAAFLCRFPHWVEAAVVIGPNTRQERTIRRIREAARRFTLLVSDRDERLKHAWFGHRPAGFWQAAFLDSVVASRQPGHGAHSYLAALRSPSGISS